ncbi:MAG: prenyltransferase/squalene oxidase repeat-containing protein [Acidihalobacter sp.]|uniref:prenyltransferase/squalene oxidase repeat-containing protein n=1 Tax=Acidihalobacter sp. TaxID=1872108 RepID=UPI00307EF5B7
MMPVHAIRANPEATGFQPDIAREAAIRYVLGRRCPQGGYSFYRTPEWGVEEPNAPDTFFALSSLRLLGVEPPQADRTAAWLSDLQEPDGGWPTLIIGWAADAALALLERGPRHDPQLWLRTLWTQRLGMANEHRDWRGTLLSLLQLTQLVRRHVPHLLPLGRGPLAHLLMASRCTDGAWSVPGADLETTAIALRLAQATGLQIDRHALTAWWRRCEDPRLGLRLTPSAGLTSAGTLHGGLEVSVSLGLQPRHLNVIATQIRLLQHPSGGFGARHRALATLQDTWLALAAANLLGKLLRENDHE